jgi:hypothetical protein
MNNDFNDFIQNKKESPSNKMDENILNFIKGELVYDKKTIYIKLVLIQSFIGLVTLLFCPQFQLSLTNSHELFHYFHHTFGKNICMMICGSIFIGSGALFAGTILNLKELKIINESKLLSYGLISILALCIFSIINMQLYITLSLFWLLGASLAGVLMFSAGLSIKSYLKA